MSAGRRRSSSQSKAVGNAMRTDMSLPEAIVGPGRTVPWPYQRNERTVRGGPPYGKREKVDACRRSAGRPADSAPISCRTGRYLRRYTESAMAAGRGKSRKRTVVGVRGRAWGACRRSIRVTRRRRSLGSFRPRRRDRCDERQVPIHHRHAIVRFHRGDEMRAARGSRCHGHDRNPPRTARIVVDSLLRQSVEIARE